MILDKGVLVILAEYFLGLGNIAASMLVYIYKNENSLVYRDGIVKNLTVT